ncbi:MFS transporter [Embleya sp. NPDC050493]|uniref:MFS transporter n=1 Tax=Embleya sp. NPDC050493 TaxID=3363989 RepID=UPI0037B89F8A
MIAPYRRLLTHPGVPRLIATDLCVKIGPPVLGVALLLVALEHLGSYTAAGLALTAHALALALCAPIGGRLADRFGARRVLVGYLAAHTGAYALLLAVLALDAPAPALIGAASLLGLTNPPAGPVIRDAWPRLVPAASLPAAYALDSAVNELMFIVGPALVSALLPVMSARTVVLVAAVTVLSGVALLILSSPMPLASATTERPADPGSRRARLIGPLVHRPTLVLLVLAAFATFGFGCLRIATAADATAFGSGESAGLLMALLSAGTLAGALGYGARAGSPHGRLALVVLCLLDAAALFTGIFAPGLTVLAMTVTASGLLSGPRDILVPILLAEQAPERYRTEVFAWLNTFTWAGYGLGTAVAGAATDPNDNGAAAFTIATAVALLSAVVAATLHHPASRPG